MTCARNAMVCGSETWAITAEWEIGMYRDDDSEMDVWCIAGR